MSLTVQLPQFEGPLALLLYLIRKEEMDIFNINIHHITQQYFEYIKIMKELDLELAGDFVAMASTLIQIKSKLLLPQYNEQGEVVEAEDPRKELVQKLLEYQKYQEAAKLLYERPLVGRDLFLRGVRETLQADDDTILLEENALFSLISSYRKVVRTLKKKVHQVAAKAQSISSRILEIKDRLIPGSRVTLNELITANEGRMRQTLITFLSLLELGKLGFVRLFQSEIYTDIHVEPIKIIETDVLSRVEDYDGLKPNANPGAAKLSITAQDLLAEAEGEQAQAVKVSTGNEDGVEWALEESDGFDFSESLVEKSISEAEMASDEEIELAEAELARNENGLTAELNDHDEIYADQDEEKEVDSNV